MHYHHACTPSASACKLEIRRRRLAPWHLQGWANRCKCTCCSFMQAMQACTNRWINGYDALIALSDVGNRLPASLALGSFNLGCFCISHRPPPFTQGCWKVKTAVACGGGALAGIPDPYIHRWSCISNGGAAHSPTAAVCAGVRSSRSRAQVQGTGPGVEVR